MAEAIKRSILAFGVPLSKCSLLHTTWYTESLFSFLICILVNSEARHVYVGIETGQISYYQMSDDLNVLESIRTFNAHNNCAVLQCIYCPLREWIFSIGSDGTLVWSDVKNGNKLGNYSLPSKPRCFQVLTKNVPEVLYF